MKKLLLLLLFIPLVSFGQEYYVSARGGVNVREAPNVKAKKVDTFFYGQHVTIESKTGIKLTINDVDKKTGITKAVQGEWVEITSFKLGNRNPYDVSGSSSEKKIKGYIFNGFLKDLYFPDYIKEDYIDISILDGDCIKYKSGVLFSGIAYNIVFGYTFVTKEGRDNYRDYGRFFSSSIPIVSPIIIKIAEFKDGIINGTQKVIDPLNDLKREVFISPKLLNENNGVFVIKFSDSKWDSSDTEQWAVVKELKFFELTGQPLPPRKKDLYYDWFKIGMNYDNNPYWDKESYFGSSMSNIEKLFRSGKENKYLKVEFKVEFKDIGINEFSDFTNDWGREYSNYINSNCEISREVTKVEIIDDFKVKTFF
tara:strand:- start:152 stop:1252 length:1101 start_codon:yes stop_codon:yes gene_type:complete